MDFEKPSFGAIAGSISRPSWAVLLLLFVFVAILSMQLPTDSVFLALKSSEPANSGVSEDRESCAGFFQEVPPRKVVMSIKDFGGVGDGKTSNTKASQKAVWYMKGFGERGGSQLNVPKGTWLTGSFNLTSNCTLFLEHGALILGSQGKMGLLMDKGTCGGSCGGIEH
ncbi:polygalacturonase [Tripterygium wilfordii]|uniref:Polygalacturonase n=1 Tax=Tripterygium wilfordii TaxID=458696 RepID=A0A7J7DFF2_TRIWF|nr:polygalacturonase [Tripterygium wilfordii]